MKILHVISGTHPMVTPWAVELLSGLGAAQIAAGHEVEVWSTSAGWGDLAPKALGGASVNHFRSLGRSSIAGRYGLSPGLTAALFGQIGSFDIAHVHMLFPLSSGAAGVAGSIHSVPYVLSLHGNLDPVFDPHSRLVKRLHFHAVGRRVLRNAGVVHVISTAEQDALERWISLPRVRVSPWGVDLKKYSARRPAVSERYGLRPGRYTMFLGRLHESKGVDLLIRGFAERVVDLDSDLAIVGPDDGAGRQLMKLTAALGIADRVRFLGAVPDEDKVSLLQHAAAFAMPARTEMFGLAIVEAMATGVPVIVTKDAALSGDLRDAQAAMVIDAAPELMGQAVVDVTTNASLRARLGRAGAKYVGERFSWAAAWSALDKLYREAMTVA